jgi:transcriptional regulator with PAS, ATPase and Fis domain
VDVRIIAATNTDLRQAIRARAFREDLYYRLHVVPLGVPPLRERKSDLPDLSGHFIRKYSREFKKDVRGLSRGALLALDSYDWPGNVRELENIIERSVALATRPVIGLDDLPLDLAMNEVTPGREGDQGALTLKEARDRFEQAYVLRALEREDWNQSRAARGRGVHRNTLIARLAAWGVRREQSGPSARPVAGGGPA